jgi:hypothetical protein
MDQMFPVGRLVSGSVEKLFAQTESDNKTPKLGKDGKPMMSVSFGVAIPKTQADWRLEPWGKPIFELGKSSAQQMCMNPHFAWKIDDGDSQIPNKKGKINADRKGFPGNWIVWFSQGWAPKLVNADGTVELAPGAIVTGYYVQVYAGVAYNNADINKGHTPGMYMNPIAVALAGVGEKIISDVDTASVGFGGTLPPGAQPVPSAVEGASFGATVAPTAPTLVQVEQNTAFMEPPPPVPTAPAAPAAPAAPVMSAKANGMSYQQFIDAGWSHEQLQANGYIA